MIRTAYIERLNATYRARLASLKRRRRALVRQTLTHGMYLISTVYNFVTPHERFRRSQRQADASDGRGDHRSWLDELGTAVVACATAALEPI